MLCPIEIAAYAAKGRFKAISNSTVNALSQPVFNTDCEEATKTKAAQAAKVILLPRREADSFSMIPEEMQQHETWVCWVKEDRNGKTTKIPRNPKTGGNASTTLSATWATFEEAEKYYSDHPDIDGIGYVFTESNGVVGIDFDHCVKDGEITSEEIRELVERCTSYVEVSPSGTGIHMYVKGKWKETGGRKNNNLGNGMAVEVYPSARFFTVTGNAFGEARPLNEDQALLDEIHDRYFTAKDEPKALLPAKLEDLGVESEYIRRLQARLENRHSWLSLLWQGQHTKESESEADMALICRLLVICDGDEEAARKLFMASPFAHQKDRVHLEKLNRDDYWLMSINNAMEYLEQHPEFDRLDRYRPLLRYDGDSDGRASMLFEYMDGNIKYCIEQNTWLVFKDGCWIRDEGLLDIKADAVLMYQGLKATVKAIIAEKKFDDAKKQKNFRDTLMNKIRGFGSKTGINGIIDYAASYRDFRISENMIDAHDDLLAAGNGIINLRTGELLPFDRQLYITRRTEVNYNPNAPEPTQFLRFLDDISGHNQEWISYLQLCLGYCITGCTNQEAFFVMHGETGQNGKSTLLKQLQRMLPQHVKTLAPGALQKRKDLNGHNSSLAQSKNYRMVITNENDQDFHMDEQMVRAISSGEAPNVRDVYKSVDAYIPHYKIVFCGNYVPKFNWRLHANLRRLCLIPFKVYITEEQRDNDLSEKLWAEREGILKWLVDGAIRSFKEDLKHRPKCIENYTEAMLRRDDPVYAFCQDKLIVTDDPNDRVQAAPLFEEYNDWREFHDLSRLPREKYMQSFGKRLRELGYAEHKTRDAHNNWIYTGIKIMQSDCNATAADTEQER